MKTYMIIVLLIGMIVILNCMPAAWTEFQKDISIQAAQFQNSAEQQAYRQLNDTRNYIVGETKTFWRWNLAVMPPTWIQAPSTCRAVGEHCYVFVADSEWNTHITQANVDSVMVRLEQNTPNNPAQGAIAMDINLFGPIPDALDNDPKLIVFYSALGSFNGSQFDGYFSAYNQVTEAEAQQMNPPGHSNLCEMIYMTCYPLSPVAPIRLSVLAHELEHLIHWGQDTDEESWIDEGCAELAMVAYGVPDPISSFNNNPDNDLTLWEQQTADYVKVMLFFTYLKEHYDETGLISALIADPTNGMTSFSNQVNIHYPGLSVGKILRNWTIANMLDSPQPDSGLYNYEGLNMPNFTMTNVNQHPVTDLASIEPYAADYLFYDLAWRPITFNIEVNTPIHISELIFNSDQECIAVIDGGLTTQIEYNPLPDSANYVIFVLTNPNATAVDYSYAAGVVGNEDENAVAVANPVMNCFPNPFNSSNSGLEIRLSITKGSATTGMIDIYNAKGQHIRHLNVSKATDSSELCTSWDGRNKDNELVSGGIYLLRYDNGKQRISKSVFVRK